MVTSSLRLQNGFTLIEMLISICIIGIIMVIVITSYGNSVQRANDQQVKTNVENIRTSLELYRRSTAGYYPSNLNQLKTANFIVPNYPRTDSIAAYNYQPLPSGCDVLDACTSYQISAALESTDEVYIATPQSSDKIKDPNKTPTPTFTLTPTPRPSKTPTPRPTNTPLPPPTRIPTPTYACAACPSWTQFSVVCGEAVSCPSGQAMFRCDEHRFCYKCMASNQCSDEITPLPFTRTPTRPTGYDEEAF